MDDFLICQTWPDSCVFWQTVPLSAKHNQTVIGHVCCQTVLHLHVCFKTVPSPATHDKTLMSVVRHFPHMTKWPDVHVCCKTVPSPASHIILFCLLTNISFICHTWPVCHVWWQTFPSSATHDPTVISAVRQFLHMLHMTKMSCLLRQFSYLPQMTRLSRLMPDISLICRTWPDCMLQSVTPSLLQIAICWLAAGQCTAVACRLCISAAGQPAPAFHSRDTLKLHTTTHEQTKTKIWNANSWTGPTRPVYWKTESLKINILM